MPLFFFKWVRPVDRSQFRRPVARFGRRGQAAATSASVLVADVRQRKAVARRAQAIPGRICSGSCRLKPLVTLSIALAARHAGRLREKFISLGSFAGQGDFPVSQGEKFRPGKPNAQGVPLKKIYRHTLGELGRLIGGLVSPRMHASPPTL